MINKDNFIKYLYSKFSIGQIFIRKFKPDLWFVEVNCFPEKDYKLALEVSTSDIKISTVAKEPAFDFSLYDFVFEHNLQAEEFINKAYANQKFPR